MPEARSDKYIVPIHTPLNSPRYVPPTWTYECDEDLVHYFYDHIGKEDENLGSVKQCVTSIDVSSCSVSRAPMTKLVVVFFISF